MIIQSRALPRCPVEVDSSEMKENKNRKQIIEILQILEDVYKYDFHGSRECEPWELKAVNRGCHALFPLFNYETPLLHMRNTPPTGGQESFIFVSPG